MASFTSLSSDLSSAPGQAEEELPYALRSLSVSRLSSSSLSSPADPRDQPPIPKHVFPLPSFCGLAKAVDAGGADSGDGEDSRGEKGPYEGPRPNDPGDRPSGAAGVKPKKDKDGYPGTRRCYLERRRGMAHGATHYVVYAEDTLELLAACSTSPGGGSSYYFSEDEVDFVKHGEGFLGEMWGSMGGTRWGLYDDGVEGGMLEEMERRQRALLIYDTNVLGRVPNAMRIVVPRPGGGWEGRGSMHVAWQKSKGDFVEVRTKKPKWNPRMEAWTMDFKGRAKVRRGDASCELNERIERAK